MSKKLNVQRKLKAFHMSRVDIIIPVDENYSELSDLISGILGTVRSNRYQISLVDDNTKNSSFCRNFEKYPGIFAYNHHEIKGHYACVKTALENTRQPWILFCHPDVKPKYTDWLENLGRHLSVLKQEGVKMVGPLLSDSDFDYQKMTEQSFDNSRKLQKKKPIILENDDCLDNACFLCHRELFSKLGTLDRDLNPNHLAAAMHNLGFGQAICHDSWLYHKNLNHVRCDKKPTRLSKYGRQ